MKEVLLRLILFWVFVVEENWKTATLFAAACLFCFYFGIYMGSRGLWNFSFNWPCWISNAGGHCAK